MQLEAKVEYKMNKINSASNEMAIAGRRKWAFGG